jgi:tRNA(adenine34) deaminase
VDFFGDRIVAGGRPILFAGTRLAQNWEHLFTIFSLNRTTDSTRSKVYLMVLQDDEHFMREAIRIACEKGTDPSLNPIGCVIVMQGRILAACRNKVSEHRDSVAHAEIEAIRAAGSSFENGELRGATLYSTLQPCGMCTMASIWSKVHRIVFGAGREDVHKMYFEARAVNTLDFVTNAYRDDIVVDGGVPKRRMCSTLLSILGSRADRRTGQHLAQLTIPQMTQRLGVCRREQVRCYACLFVDAAAKNRQSWPRSPSLLGPVVARRRGITPDREIGFVWSKSATV